MAGWEGRSGGRVRGGWHYPVTRSEHGAGGRRRALLARLRAGSRRGLERGAAAVEAAVVVTLLLVPLVIGVLHWGDYFWRAQQVDTLAPAVPEGSVAGTFTCADLKELVAASVVDVVDGLGVDLPLVPADDVVVTVVEVLPDVGVVVHIHVEVPNEGGLSSLVELPDGGNLVTDFTQRLDDVRISDQGCR